MSYHEPPSNRPRRPNRGIVLFVIAAVVLVLAIALAVVTITRIDWQQTNRTVPSERVAATATLQAGPFGPA